MSAERLKGIMNTQDRIIVEVFRSKCLIADILTSIDSGPELDALMEEYTALNARLEAYTERHFKAKQFNIRVIK
jgi:hypothetical protein